MDQEIDYFFNNLCDKLNEHCIHTNSGKFSEWSRCYFEYDEDDTFYIIDSICRHEDESNCINDGISACSSCYSIIRKQQMKFRRITTNMKMLKKLDYLKSELDKLKINGSSRSS